LRGLGDGADRGVGHNAVRHQIPGELPAAIRRRFGEDATVKSRDGQSLSITLAPDVDIITLVKKRLAHIKPGDFVASTGVKDKDGKIHAIEVRYRFPVPSSSSLH
jgi:hypothetical protein